MNVKSMITTCMGGNVIIAVRVLLAVLGTIFLIRISAELLDGHISYSVGEVVEEKVTTKTIPEAVSVWLTFGSLFFAMIVGGIAPRMYMDRPWLWKLLLLLIFGGYVLSAILR